MNLRNYIKETTVPGPILHIISLSHASAGDASPHPLHLIKSTSLKCKVELINRSGPSVVICLSNVRHYVNLITLSVIGLKRYRMNQWKELV